MTQSDAMFDAMFDDAAIFPPGNAPMAAAIAAHDEHKQAPYGSLVGPFVCSASRLPELSAELAELGTAVELALVAGPLEFEAAVDAAMSDSRLTLCTVEVRMGTDDTAPVAPQGVDLFLEFPWGVEPVIPAGAARKMRTGGMEASTFPSETQLGDGIAWCVGNSVPFKLTAGLHDAIRWSDLVSGFEHHGFLNVALATHAAIDGDDAAHLASILGNRNSAQIADLIRQLSGGEVAAIRGLFRSFGTCNVTDPINDLRALGLLNDGAE